MVLRPPLSKRYSAAFLEELKAIARRSDPRIPGLWVWLLAIIAFETARTFAPDICAGGKRWKDLGPAERSYLAVGLIQFTDISLAELRRVYGAQLPDLHSLTRDRLAGMTAEGQLPYVELYLGLHLRKLRALEEPTIEDWYAAVLWPAAIGKGPHHVLFDNSHQAREYRANHGLDGDHDGDVELMEAAATVRLLADLPRLAA